MRPTLYFSFGAKKSPEVPMIDIRCDERSPEVRMTCQSGQTSGGLVG